MKTTAFWALATFTASLCVASAQETEEATTTISARCTPKELEEFSLEYEQCHSRALETIRSNQQLEILKKSYDKRLVHNSCYQGIREAKGVFFYSHGHGNVPRKLPVLKASLGDIYKVYFYLFFLA